jgi:anthranilate phosphoribosyltransferase
MTAALPTVGGLLETLTQRDLSREESADAFARIVAGELSEIELAALLAALKVRGVSAGTIAGAADALRRAALPFPRPMYPFADTCGTGGDYTGSVNISTAAAFVAAELGVPVAKHGNRAVSSRCGSADVLAQCGAVLDAPPEVSRRALDEAGVCFLFAPVYHAGVRHAMAVRKALATRTVFNLLGPLINPARPTWQVLGVFDPAYCRPLAETLGLLGCLSALVVHGDGVDELAVHAPTTAAFLRDGQVTELEVTPEEAGLARHPVEALRGGGPEENAVWLRELLAGRAVEAHADAVALNAGALAWVAGKAESLADGAAEAKGVLARGTARCRLDRFVEITRNA